MSEFELFATLRAEVGQFSAKMAEARHELSRTEDSSHSFGNKLASVGKGITLGLAGAAVAVGVASVKMADDWERSHARLSAAVKASGGNMAAFSPTLAVVEKHMERLGFTHAQVEDALAHATIATQNQTKAAKEMGLAADIARARNIDLTTATDLVDKAMTGNLRPLKAMGIDLPIAATNAEKLKKAHEAVAAAQQKVNDLMAAAKTPIAGVAKAHEAAAASALANEKSALAIRTAQDAVNKITAKYPDASKPGTVAHESWVRAQERVRIASDAAAVTHDKNLVAMERSAGGNKALAAAQAHLATAQASLNDQQSASGQIIDALTKRFGGQAASAADTFGGKIAALKAQGIDLGAKLGTMLIPKLEGVLSVVMKLVDWFGRHKDAAIALGVVVGGVLTTAIAAFAYKTAVDFAKSVANMARGVGDLISKLLGIGGAGGGVDKAGKSAAGALDGSAGKLQTAKAGLLGAAEKLSASAGELSAAAEKLAGAGAAETELAAGGATAETEMAAGGRAGAGGLLGKLRGPVTAGGALGALGAGVAAEQATSMLLHHTPLGGAVNSAASSVAGLFGFHPADDARKREEKKNTGLGLLSYITEIASGKVPAVPGGYDRQSARQYLHDLGIKGYASGGWVGGPSGAAQLAVIHGGEYVESRQEAGQRKAGKGDVHVHIGNINSAAQDMTGLGRDLAWELHRVA